MPLFRRPIPRRAFVAAALGALYATLLLVASRGEPSGILRAAAWFILSVGLLFLTAFAYHAYTTWAILWVVWRSVEFYRSGSGQVVAFLLDDVLFPAVSALLLITSGYLHEARAAKEDALEA